MPFSGVTYDPVLDRKRLSTQLVRVARLMSDGKWRTLAQIRECLNAGSEAGISARLRDLRKAKFGGYQVDRRRREAGLWEYRLDLGESWEQLKMQH